MSILNTSDTVRIVANDVKEFVLVFYKKFTRTFKMSTLHSMNVRRIVANAPNLKHFTSAFYKAVTEHEKDQRQNIICSSLTASIVLSMLTYDVSKEAEKQFTSVLHLAHDETIDKHGYQCLIDTLNAIATVQLRIANRIFVDNAVGINPEYQKFTKTYFRSVTKILDFNNCVKASKIVNNWCDKKIKRRFTQIVQPCDLMGMRIVVVNVVYFKGKWRRKFKTAYTEPKAFHVDEGRRKLVPMMYREGIYTLSEISELDARCIKLPYQSKNAADQLSMFIILPNKIDGLKTIDDRLQIVDFLDLHENRSAASRIALRLPKFKVESTFNLKSIFRKMSITNIFDYSANFQGIETDELRNENVTNIIQKAFIEVDEKGAEAVVADECCTRGITPFVVDRPFFCAIVATHMRVQLFSARILDPTM